MGIKPLPPEPRRLVADLDPTLVETILKDRGNRMYSITAGRMISELVRK